MPVAPAASRFASRASRRRCPTRLRRRTCPRSPRSNVELVLRETCDRSALEDARDRCLRSERLRWIALRGRTGVGARLRGAITGARTRVWSDGCVHDRRGRGDRVVADTCEPCHRSGGDRQEKERRGSLHPDRYREGCVRGGRKFCIEATARRLTSQCARGRRACWKRGGGSPRPRSRRSRTPSTTWAWCPRSRRRSRRRRAGRVCRRSSAGRRAPRT